jgi:hypothetical protein
MLRLKAKLRACPHHNVNAYDYVRNDGLLDDLIHEGDSKKREAIEGHLTGMRFCLDCGSTQRFKLRDPLAITSTSEKEPWLAPWFWRK